MCPRGEMLVRVEKWVKSNIRCHSCMPHVSHHHNSGPHSAFPPCPSHSTHIYPLQITAGNRGWHHSIVGVDDRNYVHPQKFMECAVQVAALLLIMKIQVGHQNLEYWKDMEKVMIKSFAVTTLLCCYMLSPTTTGCSWWHRQKWDVWISMDILHLHCCTMP